VAAFLALGSVRAFAEDISTLPDDELVARRETLKFSIEGAGGFNFVTPQDPFGNWGMGYIAFFYKPIPVVKLFAQADIASQYDGKRLGSGILGTVGTYVDWTSWFHTYTALGAGTNCTFLPLLRVDQDLIFSIKWFSIIGGITYYKYHEYDSFYRKLAANQVTYYKKHIAREDLTPSVGLGLYINKFIAEIRGFRNVDNPGNSVSYSGLFSLGYGMEGRHWTYGTFIYGEEAYLVNNLAQSLNVREQAYSISVSHRHWIGFSWGLFGALTYMHMSLPMDNYGILLGAFKEW